MLGYQSATVYVFGGNQQPADQECLVKKKPLSMYLEEIPSMLIKNPWKSINYSTIHVFCGNHKLADQECLLIKKLYIYIWWKSPAILSRMLGNQYTFVYIFGGNKPHADQECLVNNKVLPM